MSWILTQTLRPTHAASLLGLPAALSPAHPQLTPPPDPNPQGRDLAAVVHGCLSIPGPLAVPGTRELLHESLRNEARRLSSFISSLMETECPQAPGTVLALGTGQQ